MDVSSLSHSKWNCKYHIVFAPKYRRKVAYGALKQDIANILSMLCKKTPSVDDYKKHEQQLTECRQYTVEELFCSGYARYFWEAIKIRYPEYCSYVDWEALYVKG